MFPEERRNKIIAILKRQGRCLVGDLARELNVSEVTIRQDLETLGRDGMLRRTHGGAILNTKFSGERPFQVVETSYQEEKRRIAAAAVKRISPGNTVILDVGTTVTEVAKKLLAFSNLTVFTNALNTATILEGNPNITTIVTGGTLRAKQHSLVNPYAQIILEKIQVDIAFIGINGIQANYGFTNINLAEAEIKSLFINSARQKVVLADASKIGRIALTKVAEIKDIDLLITNKDADAEEIENLRKNGLEVQLV